MKLIGRRQFIKTSLSGLAFATLPVISFSQSNPDIVVIGAGAAGLSATAELMKKGISVLCIEAMNRTGGRCYADTSTFETPIDIGGHWLHNLSENQLAKFGKKHKDKFKIYPENAPSVVYHGKKKVEANELWKIYKQLKKIRYNSRADVPFITLVPEKIKKSSWFDTAAKMVGDARDLDNFSPYDDNVNWYDSGSGDGLCREGYGTLLAYYRKDVPVKLNTIVSEIKWDGKGVQVITNNGTINTKACIITTSIGVIKAEKIKFTPALPSRKIKALDGISMTYSNRVLIQLKKKFYRKFKNDTWFNTKCNSNGVKSPETYYGSLKMGGSNVSLFGISGQFAKDLGDEGEDAMIDFILNDLKSTFGSKFYEKYFIKAKAVAWSKNPLTLGSYTGAIPGKANNLRRELRMPVGDRIFFAGEATAMAFSTVHGADRSGVRAAKDLFISSALD
jgi:monoamine oxidase